ncbi:MAG: ABC transporter permease [candidate division KSB1 bacterium]|nr:ABC transporter permease [candidate division KSB1 bacterium]
MFKNHLKIAARNLLKYKVYSFINIAGLAIGMACCLLILLYVQHELAYDHFHEKADRIYRILRHGRVQDSDYTIPVNPAPLAETLVREFPEVLAATRMLSVKAFAECVVKYADKQFVENRILFADSTFFDIFTFSLLLGNSRTALDKPNRVVITEAMAQKYFGDENPMGKTLRINIGGNADLAFTITGVAKDVPPNSHFHFDFLPSLVTLDWSRSTSWGQNAFYTYFLLSKGYSAAQLEAKLPQLVQKYIARTMQFDDRFFVQPLTAIHLRSNYDLELEPNSDIIYVYIFSIIAFIVLLSACINFMNLATARSANRVREIGVRKVLGASRGQLLRQFLSESTILSVIAVLFAVGLLELFLPLFNRLAERQIAVDFTSNSFLLAGLIGMGLLVGILAGSYPAFFLSSFRPIVALRGKPQQGTRGAWLRSGLVFLQFAISIVLIIGTFVVERQLHYVRNKRLGFDKEHVVVISRASALGPRWQAFKHELMWSPNVIHTAGSSSVPGRYFDSTVFEAEGMDESQRLWYVFADEGFIETMGMEMVAGRNFSPEFATETSAFILNETAVKKLGWENAVGKKLAGNARTGAIIGVVKDFHFESLHQEIHPLVMLFATSPSYLSVRVRQANLHQTLTFLEEKWRSFVPDQPFEYSFLDEAFDKLYRSEERLEQIFGYFSTLAIFIACLGLFGLASFTAEQRTKEIGIRKVLGASVASILFLLSKDFGKLVLLANFIAWPVAWYAMNRWLQNYAYRIEIGWWVFALAGGLALIIAFATVSTQAFKAALANPVQVLRYE